LMPRNPNKTAPASWKFRNRSLNWRNNSMIAADSRKIRNRHVTEYAARYWGLLQGITESAARDTAENIIQDDRTQYRRTRPVDHRRYAAMDWVAIAAYQKQSVEGAIGRNLKS